jgi:hypothetical protein
MKCVLIQLTQSAKFHIPVFPGGYVAVGWLTVSKMRKISEICFSYEICPFSYL